jgi:hypothetical protein
VFWIRHDWPDGLLELWTGPVRGAQAPAPPVAANTRTVLFTVGSPKFHDPHGIHIAYACKGTRVMGFGYPGRRGRMGAKVSDIEMAKSTGVWKRLVDDSPRYHC